MNCNQTFKCEWEGHCETIEAVHVAEQSNVHQCQHRKVNTCLNCRHERGTYKVHGIKCGKYYKDFPDQSACFGWEAKR